MSTEDVALEREFDTLMAKAGVNIPADRRQGTIAGYRDFQPMTALLRQPRTAAAEPANTYSLVPFMKKI